MTAPATPTPERIEIDWLAEIEKRDAEIAALDVKVQKWVTMFDQTQVLLRNANAEIAACGEHNGRLRVERNHERARADKAEAERDEWKSALLDMTQYRDRGCAEIRRLREAILWALGEGNNFPPRPPGAGSYWWRRELRQRAALAAGEVKP